MGVKAAPDQLFAAPLPYNEAAMERAVSSLAAVAIATAILGAADAARAWTPATQLAIAEAAASIAPPDLARQIERHEKAFRAAVLAPFREAPDAAHVKNPDGRGAVDEVIDRSVTQAVEAIRAHRPFAEIVTRLGAVAHFVADANNPLNTSDGDPREGTYFTDYLRYVESAQNRFPIVVYREGRDLRSPADVRRLVDSTLARSRGLYPLIGREYQRVGAVDGISLFDDRSTAFGAGSVAFSHAVSDVAATLRYVWLEAGGGDPRALGWTAPGGDLDVATATR